MSSTNRSEGLEQRACERYWDIVEREALGEYQEAPGEKAFVEEHLRACPDCGAFHAALRGFGEEPPQEVDLLVRRVTDAYYSRREVRRRRARQIAWGSAAVLAAAAAVLLVFVVGLLREPPVTPAHAPKAVASAAAQPIPLEVAGGALTVNGSEASPGSALAEGASVATNATESLLKSKGSIFSVGLDAKTEIGIRQLRRDRVALELRQGLVAVDLAKDQDVRFTIDARSARVTVTGTMFSVESAVDDVTVRVVRGSVRVESPSWPEKAIDVQAGWSLSVASKELAPLKGMPKYAIFSLLGLTSDAGRSEAPPAEAATGDTGSSAQDGAKTAGRALTRGADGRGSRRRPAPGARVEPEEAPSANDLIRAARVCRRNRDWQCAISSYGRVAELYPATPEAATVLLPLADIELENLNRPRQALDHYDAYYLKHPQGPLAQEALYGKCRALAALHQAEREKAALELFLDRYPQSLYASHARARLEQLSR